MPALSENIPTRADRHVAYPPGERSPDRQGPGRAWLPGVLCGAHGVGRGWADLPRQSAFFLP